MCGGIDLVSFNQTFLSNGIKLKEIEWIGLEWNGMQMVRSVYTYI